MGRSWCPAVAFLAAVKVRTSPSPRRSSPVASLPEAWIMPSVPELMSPDDIETTLEFEFGKVEPPLPTSVDLRVTAADLDAVLVGRRWTPVWRLGLDGLAEGCPTPLPSDERGICRWADPNVIHVFDAETGDWLGTAEMFTNGVTG